MAGGGRGQGGKLTDSTKPKKDVREDWTPCRQACHVMINRTLKVVI